VKKKLEITLKTIHVGTARRVVTLRMGQNDAVNEDLLSFAKADINKFKKLKTAMRVISEHRHYSNDQKFKNLGGGLYEIKIHGYRVYAFLDEHSQSAQQLVVCSLCDIKSKQQSANITTARSIKENYLKLTKNGVTPELILLPHEKTLEDE